MLFTTAILATFVAATDCMEYCQGQGRTGGDVSGVPPFCNGDCASDCQAGGFLGGGAKKICTQDKSFSGHDTCLTGNLACCCHGDELEQGHSCDSQCVYMVDYPCHSGIRIDEDSDFKACLFEATTEQVRSYSHTQTVEVGVSAEIREGVTAELGTGSEITNSFSVSDASKTIIVVPEGMLWCSTQVGRPGVDSETTAGCSYDEGTCSGATHFTVSLPGSCSTETTCESVGGCGFEMGGGGGGIKCFPMEARVELKSGEIVKMRDLKLGDFVRDGASSYSEVVSWLHKDEDAHSEFVRIQMATGQIVLSSTHLVETAQGYRKAKDVKVGMKLLRVQDGQEVEAEVLHVDSKYHRGYVAPLTNSGKIVVDGYKASCYAAIPTNGQWLADLIMLPSKLFGAAYWEHESEAAEPMKMDPYTSALQSTFKSILHRRRLLNAEERSA